MKLRREEMKNKHKNSKKRSQREEHEEINVRIPRKEDKNSKEIDSEEKR